MADLKESYQTAILIVVSGFTGGLAADAIGDPPLEQAAEIVAMLVILTVFIHVIAWMFERYWPDDEAA